MKKLGSGKAIRLGSWEKNEMSAMLEERFTLGALHLRVEYSIYSKGPGDADRGQVEILVCWNIRRPRTF